MRDDGTALIIGACIEVHRRLGPGLLESIYQQALALEFERRRIPFVRHPQIDLWYGDVRLVGQLVPDFIVFDEVVVELKAVEQIHPIHIAQLRTYVKLAGMSVGLLTNFGAELMRDGIRRVAVAKK